MPFDYAIDFGTSNSAIARWAGEAAEIIPNAGAATTPSAVYDTDGTNVIVGQGALNLIGREPDNVMVEFKLRMGMGAEAERVFGRTGRRVMPVQLAAEVIRTLLAAAAKEVPGGARSAVITTPAAASLQQVAATMEAARLAGLKHCETYPEPMAAALAYSNAMRLRNGLYLVYDLGGGTFDSVLIDMVDGNPTLLGNRGERTTGGALIDQGIVDQILLPALQQAGFDVVAQGGDDAVARRAAVALRRVAEKAKQALSQAMTYDVVEASLFRDAAGNEVDLSTTITRKAVEAIARPCIDSTIACCRALLRDAKRQSSDIQAILLVGGPTKMPFLRPLVTKGLDIAIFDAGVDPMTAVALGAAIYAATRPTPPEEGDLCVPGVVTLRMTPDAGRSDAPEVIVELSPPPEDPALLTGATLELQSQSATIGWRSGLRAIPPTRQVIFDEIPATELGAHHFRPVVVLRDGRSVAVQPEVVSYTRTRASAPQDYLLHSVGLLKGDNQFEVFFERRRRLPCENTRSLRVRERIERDGAGAFEVLFQEGERRRADRNRPVGRLRIGAAQLTADLAKDSEIVISLSIDRSREMRAKAHHPDTGQAWSGILQLDAPAPSTLEELRDSLDRLHKRRAEVVAVLGFVAGKPRPAEEVASLTAQLEAVEFDRRVATIAEAIHHAAREPVSALRADDALRDAHGELDEIVDILDPVWTIWSAHLYISRLEERFKAPAEAGHRAEFATLRSRALDHIAKQDAKMIRSAYTEILELHDKTTDAPPQRSDRLSGGGGRTGAVY